MARVKNVRTSSKRPSTWSDALEKYLTKRKAEGLRPTTLKAQRDTITLFFKRHPNAFDGYDELQDAVYAFLGEDVKASTYNYRVTYLKTFIDFCVDCGVYSVNPLEGFKKRRADGRIVQIDQETLKRLLELPNKKTYAGLRDYALLLLTLDTGIRPKEAFALLKDDINLRSCEVYIRADVSKTKISRTLPISPMTARVIEKLMDNRHPDWKDDVPVFCTYEGKPFSIYRWNERLQVYSKHLGVHIRPYDLRHTFALYFLRNGGHALALQRMMGHSDLSMTKRYVALTDGDIRQQHDMASPAMRLVQQSKRVRKVRK